MEPEISVCIKLLNEKAVLPKYASSGSSGVDLVSTETKTLYPNVPVLISTGISIAIPEGMEAQIRSRSGLAAKHGIFVLNSPGTIDSDYRGEIKVILMNGSGEIFTVKEGDRIAQMVFSWVEKVEFEPSTTLSATERGEGGFGSTGK